MGVFIGSALILIVACLLVGWLGAGDTKSLVLVGLLWLALTVTFELCFGHFVFGRSWQDLAADYDLRGGGLLLVGMIVLAFSPLIAARMQASKQE